MNKKKPTAAITALTARILPHVLEVMAAEAGAALMATALAYELRAKSASDFEAWIDELQALARNASRSSRKYAYDDERKRPRGYRALKLPGAMAMLVQEDADRRTSAQAQHNRIQALAALNLACELYIDLCAERRALQPIHHQMVLGLHQGHPMRYIVAVPADAEAQKQARQLVRREVRRQANFDPAELHQPLLFAALKRYGLTVLPLPVATFDVHGTAANDQ